MAINFTDKTYERILARCLNRLPSTVDKREGSIVYDAIAPAASELAALYQTFSMEMDRAFADTATGRDLSNKAKERGVFRLEATRAVRRGEFTGPNGPMGIPLGSRFSGGAANYAATLQIGEGAYQMTCEEPGAAGNDYFGMLIPIDHIDGLASATLSDILIPGEDEEEDEALRSRYIDSLQQTAFGGNVTQYREAVKKQPGVGLVKVFPTFAGGYKPSDVRPPAGASEALQSLSELPEGVKTWLYNLYSAAAGGMLTVGAGTVKLVLVSNDRSVPSSTLISAVQTALDPESNAGEGMGLAPIGHRVTVEAASGKAVDISFTVTMESGVTWNGIEAAVKETIQAYFDSLVAAWEDAPNLVVRVSQIESRILDVNGVLDIQGTSINGQKENLVLCQMEIPIMGTVVNT